MLHDGIVPLFARIGLIADSHSALDIVVVRLSGIAKDVERADGGASWTLAGARHTVRRIESGLALESVLARGCELGVRECEQTLNGANRSLALTRWIIDPDSRAIFARTEIEFDAITLPWAIRTFGVSCLVHAGFAAGIGAGVLAHCEPTALVDLDESAGEALVRGLQKHLALIDVPFADLDVVSDALREAGSGWPVRSGQRLHVPLGVGSLGATLEVRLDEQHPALGPGVLLLTNLPGGGDRNIDHRLAAALNRTSFTLGSWTPSEYGLQHVIFLPAALFDDPGDRGPVLAALALAELRRARSVMGK